MASSPKGAPVAVTGIAVVTSLGTGIADNWRKLTAGQSRIRRISRFPIDALRTTIAGTVDFVPVEPFCSTTLAEKLADLVAEEAITQASIGAKGDFPGPLFLAVAPVEVDSEILDLLIRLRWLCESDAADRHAIAAAIAALLKDVAKAG